METEIPVSIKSLDDLQVNHNYEFNLKDDNGRMIGKYAGKNSKGELTFLFEEKYFNGRKSNLQIKTTRDKLNCKKGNLEYLGDIEKNNEIIFDDVQFLFAKSFLNSIQ